MGSIHERTQSLQEVTKVKRTQLFEGSEEIQKRREKERLELLDAQREHYEKLKLLQDAGVFSMLADATHTEELDISYPLSREEKAAERRINNERLIKIEEEFGEEKVKEMMREELERIVERTKRFKSDDYWDVFPNHAELDDNLEWNTDVKVRAIRTRRLSEDNFPMQTEEVGVVFDGSMLKIIGGEIVYEGSIPDAQTMVDAFAQAFRSPKILI